MEIKQSAEYRKWFKKLRDHKAKAAIQARLDACKLAGGDKSTQQTDIRQAHDILNDFKEQRQ